jgi:putative salt-induced outer membrane protein
MKSSFAIAALAVFSASAAAAAPLPPAVGAMIDAAAADPAQLKAIVEIAKKTNPDAVAEIDARVAGLEAAQAKAREEKLANQGLMDGWSGQGEAGAFVSSGNTSNRGVAIGATVVKETRQWKHSLRGLVDYQEDNGVKSRERYFAGYEGNYNITPNFYALVTLSYERDVFSGFNRRFTESIGLGYRLVNTPSLTVGIEGGPALRQTRFTDGVDDNAVAARGALNAKWLINDGLTLTQNATIFYDSFNTSVYSLTSLTAKVSGALSARLSFQLNSESNPPIGLENLDTISRVTLVYAF